MGWLAGHKSASRLLAIVLVAGAASSEGFGRRYVGTAGCVSSAIRDLRYKSSLYKAFAAS